MGLSNTRATADVQLMAIGSLAGNDSSSASSSAASIRSMPIGMGVCLRMMTSPSRQFIRSPAHVATDIVDCRAPVRAFGNASAIGPVPWNDGQAAGQCK